MSDEQTMSDEQASAAEQGTSTEQAQPRTASTGHGGPGVMPVDHRRLGVDLYNATWGLLDRPERTPEDDDAMIASAHASMYHWSRVEGVAPENVGRGHWLCSRVHAVLGQPDAASYHARRYVAIAEAGPVADWDLAAAFEASARAAAVGGDWEAAEDFATRARTACAAIAEDDDREVIEADLAAVPHRP